MHLKKSGKLENQELITIIKEWMHSSQKIKKILEETLTSEEGLLTLRI